MVQVLLENVRLAFAQNIFEKGAVAGGKPNFSCKAIFDPKHPAVKLLAEAEAQAAQDKWSAKAEKMLTAIRKADNGVVHDGDMKPNWDGFEDNLYLNCNADNRPGIYDRDRTPLAQSDGRPYSGCYVNMRVDVWPMDNQFGQKINATLLGLQFVKDGDSFAAGAPPAGADDFADLGVDEKQADPLFD